MEVKAEIVCDKFVIICFAGVTPVMSSALAKSHPLLPAVWLMAVAAISTLALCVYEARMSKQLLAAQSSLESDIELENRPTDTTSSVETDPEELKEMDRLGSDSKNICSR